MTAVVLLGVAGLVGAVAWFASGDDALETTPVDTQQTTLAPARVMDLTPWEKRKKGRLEAGRREIEAYKRKGKVLENGTIKVPDVDGSPLYVHPELIEGTGRYGEPLYAMARYKRRAAVPIRKEVRSALPEAAMPKVKRLPKGETPLTFGEKPEHLKALESGGGLDDAGGGGGDTGDNRDGPGKPKDG